MEEICSEFSESEESEELEESEEREAFEESQHFGESDSWMSPNLKTGIARLIT